MKTQKPIVYSLVSALLLSVSWIPHCTFFIFFAFIPLFFITDYYADTTIKRRKLKQFGLIYLTFLLWNLLTTWWVYNASPVAVAAFVLNALFMTWVFRIAVWFKKYNPAKLSYFLVIPFWLAFEYLHVNWELSWPWLTVGNVFSYQHKWVQWYEFTGISGGTLWVWMVNILIYKLLSYKIQTRSWNKKVIAISLATIILPLSISYILYHTIHSRVESSKLPAQKIIVVQPNIDPYNEKFVFDQQTQLDKLMTLLFSKDSSLVKKANYIVLPETFLTENIWERDLEEGEGVIFLKEKLLSLNLDLAIVTGANTLNEFLPGETPSATARKFSDADLYYDSYNTALQIDTSLPTQVYHKSKLVPGVEIIPFPWLFKPLEKYALDLGGTIGSLGIQKERTVFVNKKNGVKTAPVVCYESVYPEYVAEYIKNGANFICIITNDGWWGNTPGYRQHLIYGSLRSIETRKPIVRSANTGVSCFINERGDISQATPYWEDAIISAEIQPNTYQTFFVKFGDLISKAALILMCGIILIGLIKRFSKR